MPTRPRRLLDKVITKLESLHGTPTRPRVRDPYQMALQEAVAYLVDDSRRKSVFEKLRREIGLEPEEILGVSPSVLAFVIRDGGMKPEMRAEKVRKCAQIASEVGVRKMRSLVRKEPAAARKLLKRFPGIGDPGADRILLFAGTHRGLAPDSNALRVLVRLGYGQESSSYARTYRTASEAVEPDLPRDFDQMVGAHRLLRRHGQEICRRHPVCEACPLTGSCQWYRTFRGRGRPGPGS